MVWYKIFPYFPNLCGVTYKVFCPVKAMARIVRNCNKLTNPVVSGDKAFCDFLKIKKIVSNMEVWARIGHALFSLVKLSNASKT